jgi:hypothetical protein
MNETTTRDSLVLSDEPDSLRIESRSDSESQGTDAYGGRSPPTPPDNLPSPRTGICYPFRFVDLERFMSSDRSKYGVWMMHEEWLEPLLDDLPIGEISDQQWILW